MHTNIPFSGNVKVGILGGGQLGKMIIDEVMRYDIHVGVLDPSTNPPAAAYAHECVKGDFRNYDDVMAFAKDYDVLTIEIEDVNTEALRKLQAEGKKIFPQPEVVDIFRDKCVQKDFYNKNNIATSAYQNHDGIPASPGTFPFVWKAATGGYDGKGVSVIKSQADYDQLPDVPCVIEQLVDIDREIGVVVHRNVSGEVVAFPPVEMEFHPEANLVELVFMPANISQALMDQSVELACSVARATGIVGTLAVELFLTKSGELLVNECAPRVHNSGHLSIEACFTSQFEQHMRAILDLPLGDTAAILPAAMGNVLGDAGSSGPVAYTGAENMLQASGLYLHLYGKTETRPYRKMGHITCINKDVEVARETVRNFRKSFKIHAL